MHGGIFFPCVACITFVSKFNGNGDCFLQVAKHLQPPHAHQPLHPKHAERAQHTATMKTMPAVTAHGTRSADAALSVHSQHPVFHGSGIQIIFPLPAAALALAVRKWLPVVSVRSTLPVQRQTQNQQQKAKACNTAS